jgi:hypothetical protein
MEGFFNLKAKQLNTNALAGNILERLKELVDNKYNLCPS